MRIIFNIVISIAIIVVLGFFIYVAYRNLTDSKAEPTTIVKKIEKESSKQDSLLSVIKTLEDSLSKKKVERIKEIEIRYEKAVDGVLVLNPTEQVELLTRNLSEINGN